MESKPSKVTQLPTRNQRTIPANQTELTTPTVNTDVASPKKYRLGNAVVKGIAKLIQGQRQFAEEFGLSSARVFPQTHHLFDGNSPEKSIKQIFRSGESGVLQLEALFNDMVEHQLALFSAIDAVAEETLNSLSPKIVSEEYPGRFATKGSKWSFYLRYHKEFQINDNFRFNMIVAPGFVKKYSKTREHQKLLK